LEDTVFNSQEIAVILRACEEVLNRLGIVRGFDLERERLIARRMIGVAGEGPVEHERLVRETLDRALCSGPERS
jgi:hypothetical protein